MNRNVLQILADFLTIVLGSFVATLNYLDSRSTNVGTAFGISLIVLGIMIRLWRREFAIKRK